MALTGKQKRELKSLGHHLDPVLYFGKNGMGTSQYEAIEQALLDHELIKVKLGKSSIIKVKELIELVEANTRAECVQSIGKTALFYAEHPEEPKIKLPETKKK